MKLPSILAACALASASAAEQPPLPLPTASQAAWLDAQIGIFMHETTDYSLKSSPWKNGKGDMVGDLATACREGGLRFGVYLSPRSDIHKVAGGGNAADSGKQNEYNEIDRVAIAG